MSVYVSRVSTGSANTQPTEGGQRNGAHLDMRRAEVCVLVEALALDVHRRRANHAEASAAAADRLHAATDLARAAKVERGDLGRARGRSGACVGCRGCERVVRPPREDTRVKRCKERVGVELPEREREDDVQRCVGRREEKDHLRDRAHGGQRCAGALGICVGATEKARNALPASTESAISRSIVCVLLRSVVELFFARVSCTGSQLCFPPFSRRAGLTMYTMHTAISCLLWSALREERMQARRRTMSPAELPPSHNYDCSANFAPRA
jgi:hypothetical protein